MVQVLGRVQMVLGIISFFAVIVVLAVLISRGDGVGYSIVISMVLLISAVPVGRFLSDDPLHAPKAHPNSI